MERYSPKPATMPPGQKQAAPQSTAQTEQRPKKLLDQIQEAIRLKHYSYRTEITR